MRLLGQRVQIGWMTTGAMAAGGVVLGFAIGCCLVVLDTKLWLSSHAQWAANQADGSLFDAQKLLNVITESPYKACSVEEIAYLRGMVSQSALVVDAGRLNSGKFACSAHQLRSAASVATQPTMRLKDGTLMSEARSSTGSAHRTVVERNGAFVTFEPRQPVNTGPLPLNLTVRARGETTQGLTNAIEQYQNSAGHLGTLMYATRCSTHGLHCATATAPLIAAIHAEAGMVSTSGFGGGMAGILIGFAFSFRYRRRRELKQQLRRAAEGDELSVAYQPIVDLVTQQIVGAEALARWKDEEGNEVKPDVFVKIAEEFGFVGAITRTVLKRTLRDFAAIIRERPDFRMSINVAAADLSDPDFLPMLDESLKRARVNPANLAIEISERGMTDSPLAMATIRALRKRGHSIHIDDFGTGYSNLDKLLWLFADTIKIDKTFTSVIGTESAGAAILPQILAMAESLNLEVVVEGVETYRQADYFQPGTQRIYGQGWLYGRPVTAQEFHLLLAGEQTILESEESVGAFTTRPGTLRIVSHQVA